MTNLQSVLSMPLIDFDSENRHPMAFGRFKTRRYEPAGDCLLRSPFKCRGFFFLSSFKAQFGYSWALSLISWSHRLLELTMLSTSKGFLLSKVLQTISMRWPGFIFSLFSSSLHDVENLIINSSIRDEFLHHLLLAVRALFRSVSAA